MLAKGPAMSPSGVVAEPASSLLLADAVPEPAVDVLVDDDQPSKLLALKAMLADLPLRLVTATSGRNALGHVLKQDFALILMDVMIPEMDGFETAELIRQRKRSRHTPIIYLTAFAHDELKCRVRQPIAPAVVQTAPSFRGRQARTTGADSWLLPAAEWMDSRGQPC